jgi:hypothetical protein
MVMRHHGLLILPMLLPFFAPRTRHIGFIKTMQLNCFASLTTVLR